MRILFLLTIGVAGVLMGTLGGCKRPPPHTSVGTPGSVKVGTQQSTDVDAKKQTTAAPSMRVSPTPSQPVPSDPDPRSDLDTTNDVRRAIAGDPTLSPVAKKVLATTSRGVVQLTGTVPEEADKEDVRIVVSRVPGVKGIDNRIIVKR